MMTKHGEARALRDQHVERGESMLKFAGNENFTSEGKQAMALRAQAHFTAAMYYDRRAHD